MDKYNENPVRTNVSWFIIDSNGRHWVDIPKFTDDKAALEFAREWDEKYPFTKPHKVFSITETITSTVKEVV